MLLSRNGDSPNRRPVVTTAVFLLKWAAVLVCGSRANLNAQDIRLRPHIDLSVPTRISIQHGRLQLAQRIGLNVGARLILTFNPRFDAVTGVNYSPGYATLHAAGRQIDVATGSHLLTVTADARYWLVPPVRMLSWEVHTGLGVAFGGQPAYKDLFESSTVSGILGTTVRYEIGRLVGLRLRIHDRLYRVRFGGQDSRSRSPLRVSFGLDLPFLRPAY